MFENPPQFAMQRSLGMSGPLAAAVGVGASDSPNQPSMLAVLVDAERRAKRSSANAEALWKDESVQNAVRDALDIPRGNSAMVKWAHQQETGQAVRLLDVLLQTPPPGSDTQGGSAYASALRLVIRTGHAVMAASSQLVHATVQALRLAELDGVEGDAALLFCEVVSFRGSWAATSEG